ncbi:MAG: Aurachin B dehydrogenase [Verrucomicrobiae bacterium]|nr:Aurachin B dehydrogenase [Verrucomicrobiae bacterium]
MSEMPLIAITGATGFVGRAIVKQARAEGYPVRAIVRDPRESRWLADEFGCELFHGNVLHAPALAGAFAGVKCVIHLVGIIIEKKENTFERAHTEATQNVIAEAKSAGVKRLIHMSALGTRADGRSRYHQTKWAAEEAVRKSGLAWTIFRPSLIYGPGNKSISVLSKIVKYSPIVPVLGNGESKIQPVGVDVVAQSFVTAIRHDETVQHTYDLCGPAAFTWNELYDKLLAAQGLRKPKIHLPLPIARVQAKVFEALLPNPPFTSDQLIMTGEDNTGNPEPAVAAFGLTLESFEQGLARS